MFEPEQLKDMAARTLLLKLEQRGSTQFSVYGFSNSTAL